MDPEVNDDLPLTSRLARLDWLGFHFPWQARSCYPLADKANVWARWGVALSIGGVSCAHIVDRRGAMGLQFGICDHIEPVPGLTLSQIYRERGLLLERYDAAGFDAYHLAGHHERGSTKP
jgi:hypothetical protein